MTTILTSPASQTHSQLSSRGAPLAALLLSGWFILVLLTGAAGAFISPPGTAPLPIAAGVVAPLSLFLLALWLSRGFREFVLTLDLRLLIGIQAWRFAGFGFLALYVYHVLPAGFAAPAGLGDMAVGLTAPWLLVALARRPAFAASRLFRLWNWFGILDLVTALSTATFSSIFLSAATGAATMAPMAQLPLLLIPAYLVPLFLMVHIASLLQARRAISAGRAAG